MYMSRLTLELLARGARQVYKSRLTIYRRLVLTLQTRVVIRYRSRQLGAIVCRTRLRYVDVSVGQRDALTVDL